MGIRSFAAELLLPSALQPRTRTPADTGPKTEAASFAEVLRHSMSAPRERRFQYESGRVRHLVLVN